MNMELYIAILETSVEHLNKLQNLLSAKYAVSNTAISREGLEIEAQNIELILTEITETAKKIESGAIRCNFLIKTVEKSSGK